MKKNTSNTAEARMEKAMLITLGGVAAWGVSVLTLPAFGAYMAYTAAAASFGKAASLGAGFLGLCAGGVATVPGAFGLMAVGALTIKTARLAVNTTKSAVRFLTMPLRSVIKAAAEKASIPVPAEQKPSVLQDKTAKADFDHAKTAGPKAKAKAPKPAPKNAPKP